jgi:DNA-binding NarL/FixJ family response regulator
MSDNTLRPSDGMTPAQRASSTVRRAAARVSPPAHPELDADPPIGVVLGRFGPLVGHGLRQVLSEDRGLRILADELDGGALERAAAESTARVAMISDVDVTGRVALTRLWALRPSLGVVVLAWQPTSTCPRLLDRGVTACLTFDAPTPEILGAIHLAAGRRQPAALASVKRGPSRASPPERPAGIGSLTRREHDVLGLLSKGESNAEIARQLHVGIETVRTHVAHILGKLGARTRLDLIDIPLPRDSDKPRWPTTLPGAFSSHYVNHPSGDGHVG